MQFENLMMLNQITTLHVIMSISEHNAHECSDDDSNMTNVPCVRA